MYQKLFPQLVDQQWRNFDLGYLSSLFFPKDAYPDKNPLLSPAYCDRWIHRMNQLFHADLSWGGWMEDRTHLWRGSYLCPSLQQNDQRIVHLGVDFNVPFETEVFSPCEGVVRDVLADPDREIGWGGRVIIENFCFNGTVSNMIFAHLSPDSLPKVGDKIETGERIGRVGTYPDNGNVFPHLHVQLWNLPSGHAPSAYAAIDGYAPWREGLAIDFPDPMTVLPEQ